jgi:hypothetical protein
MRKFHLTNEQGLNAMVRYGSLRPAAPPALGINGKAALFRRYLSATEAGLHEALVAEHGEDYGQALIDGDPEIDMEAVGQQIANTQVVYLSSSGEVMYYPPKTVELILDPRGQEKDRRVPENVEANVNENIPVAWSGRRMKRVDALQRFVFKRSLQLHHVDGLSSDYLYKIAKALEESDELVLVGAGAKGKGPLVFQTNGTPYRGFLEGRTQGKKYKLLLHLSNMELRLPAEEE